MNRATRERQVRVVLLPRNRRQEQELRKQFPHWFADGKTIIPDGALDGLQLIWHSDLVVGGGGTMNREAAALGVPVYSIFSGSIGAVDRRLEAGERLVFVRSEEETATRILLRKRRRSPQPPAGSRRALDAIVNAITELAHSSAVTARTADHAAGFPESILPPETTRLP